MSDSGADVPVMPDIPSGEAVQIVSVDANTNELSFEADNLRQVLDKSRGLPVAVISIAGVYRSGKSFLLNYIKRYLEYRTNNDMVFSKWTPDRERPLVPSDSFEWKLGRKGVTNGILIWSEPFVVSSASDGLVAVFLIDSEGGRDTEKDQQLYSFLITLETILSSVQIVNIVRDIGTDDLTCLSLIANYGRLAADDKKKPFQSLMILIRDWRNHKELPFGLDGGLTRLNEHLGGERQRSGGDLLKQTFQHPIQCFLMPFPGQIPDQQDDFDGRLSHCNPVFAEELVQFVKSIASKSNIKVKCMHGQNMTGDQLFIYFSSFFQKFKSGSIPKAVDVVQETIKQHMQTIIVRCEQEYKKRMREKLLLDPLMEDAEIEAKHVETVQECNHLFYESPKMGSPDDAEVAMKKLDRLVKQRIHKLKQPAFQNKRKESKIKKVIVGVTAAAFVGGGIAVAAPVIGIVGSVVGAGIGITAGVTSIYNYVRSRSIQKEAEKIIEDTFDN